MEVMPGSALARLQEDGCAWRKYCYAYASSRPKLRKISCQFVKQQVQGDLLRQLTVGGFQIRMPHLKIDNNQSPTTDTPKGCRSCVWRCVQLDGIQRVKPENIQRISQSQHRMDMGIYLLRSGSTTNKAIESIHTSWTSVKPAKH